MTVPSWWSDAILSPGDHSESIAADVANILTRLKDKLVTNGTWTLVSEVAGTNLRVKTPVLGSGVFMEILFAKIDADTLEITVFDYLGNSIMGARRIDIEAAGNTTINYYWSKRYIAICSRRATAEVFLAGILDPELFGATDTEILNRVVANAHRSSAGTPTSLIAGTYFALDNAVSTSSARHRTVGTNGAGTAVGLVGPGGKLLFPPQGVLINQSGTQNWTGAFPGLCAVDSSIAFDTVKNVPVDTGTKKAFIVLPITTANGMRVAIMKPSVNP
jgi:hypothetical protein